MNYKYPDSPLSEITTSITLNTANREVLRITADGRLVTGKGLSADEATQEAAKLLIASFEGQIQMMVEKRIAAEREKVRVLRVAMVFIMKCGGMNIVTDLGEILCNGSWCAEQARAALAATKEDSR